jgi:putative lipoic acid-binding regulatory protein
MIAKKTQQPAVKLEFPCSYPLKIIGRATPDFTETVLTIVEQHAVIEEDDSATPLRHSRHGTFHSLSVTITATGPEQLDALHRELLASGRVKMVL